MKLPRLLFPLLAVAAAVLSHPAESATVAGRVYGSDGKPIRGALLTLSSADGMTSETVYSDGEGNFRLETKLDGKLMLRARAPLDADATQRVDVPAGAGRIEPTFKLQRLTTAQSISDSLPASAHFARIKWPTAAARMRFQTDCLSCHEIGNPFTRNAARTPEQWAAFVQLMLTYAGYSNKGHLDAYADALYRAFDGTPTGAHERMVVEDGVLHARITEWKLRGAAIAHDTEFNPADSKFYTVDQGNDSIFVTDPVSNRTTQIALADNGVPIGGSFTEHGYPVPFGLTVRHGLHSLQLGPDGRFYSTGAIGGEIGVFDPRTRSYESHRIGGVSLYPHTLRFDKSGITWFTIAQSNQIGRYDWHSAAIKVIDLPPDKDQTDGRQPLPYGIDISPLDGSIWYSKLWANKIGRLDPVTFAVSEFDPPVFGPRRLRFDSSGALWIPGFGDGKIARLDPRTMKSKTYRIPTLAGDEVEAPYALAVDPRTQDVWVTANMSDRAFRLIQKTGQFLIYPLPTRGTYLRDFIFTPDDRVCASSSPMPPRPEVLEGGMDTLVCIETNDGSTRHSRTGAQAR